MSRILSIGICDDPAAQSRPIFKVNLAKENLAVFGQNGTGKTNLLRTALLLLEQQLTCEENEQILLLDFTGRLQDLAALPHILACFDASGGSEEPVRRIFHILSQTIAQNRRKLGAQSFVQAGVAAPHCTFCIAGLSSLFAQENFAPYQASLKELARTGLAQGVSILFSAESVFGGAERLLEYNFCRLGLGMERDGYSNLFSRCPFVPPLLPGRGLCMTGQKQLEVQLFLAPGQTKIREFLTQQQERFLRGGAALPTPVKCITGDLRTENWSEYCPESLHKPGFATVGLDHLSGQPVRLALGSVNAIGIWGQKQFGKTNLLRLLLAEVLAQHPGCRVVLWDDKRGHLADVQPLLHSSGADSVPFANEEEFFSWMESQGYLAAPDAPSFSGEEYAMQNFLTDLVPEPVPSVAEHPRSAAPFRQPFTVFVIQSRAFYTAARSGLRQSELPILRLQHLISDAANQDMLFLFSEVQSQSISEPDVRNALMNAFDALFFLGDLLRFVQNRGQNTPFASTTPQELKSEFGASTSLGDGYFYEPDTGEIAKIKLLKAPDMV